MKSEPVEKKQRIVWIIDESKCIRIAEIQKLRAYCNKLRIQGLQTDRFTLVRNWFMIELGLNTGLRVSEMASLKHSNLLINGGRSSIVVLGKGDKKRAVWINSVFKNTLKTYLSYKTKFGYEIDNESYLLNNLKGDKITKRSLQKFFKAIIIKAELPSHYHIHCLRHTYATFLLESSNHNYRFVQHQLGHSSIRTTQVYAAIIESEAKKALEKMYK